MPPVPARGHAIKPLNDLTAAEIAMAIGGGTVTCEAVVRACLDRVAAREPQVHAWAYIDPDAALAAARAGTDMILTTGSEATSRGEYAYLVQEAATGLVEQGLVDEADHATFVRPGVLS